MRSKLWEVQTPQVSSARLWRGWEVQTPQVGSMHMEGSRARGGGGGSAMCCVSACMHAAHTLYRRHH